jgi:hypothetical protein
MFNPMQLMMSQIQNQLMSNPLFKRAQEMANGKNEQELEQVARNLCQQRGIDFDSALKQFQQMSSQIPKK